MRGLEVEQGESVAGRGMLGQRPVMPSRLKNTWGSPESGRFRLRGVAAESQPPRVRSRGECGGLGLRIGGHRPDQAFQRRALDSSSRLWHRRLEAT